MTEPYDWPTIIVPTDFSKASFVAMSVGQTLCVRLKRRLLLLNVFTYVPRHHYAVPVDWMVREIRQRSKQQLALARRRITRAAGSVEALLIDGQGEPAPEIIELAAKFENPILVLGTHSRTGIERFFVGSTAEEVLRHVKCPVITVGPHVAPYWDRKTLRVMLATDLTERSLGPLAFVKALWCPGMHLVILHVSSPDAAITATSWADGIRSRILEMLGEADVRNSVEFRTVVATDVSQAVQAAASLEKIDLLAIGVHRGKAFTTYTTPRTGFQIVMSAPCPVLSTCE
jgi:nucleotide-binding universal stress UspA family protein